MFLFQFKMIGTNVIVQPWFHALM